MDAAQRHALVKELFLASCELEDHDRSAFLNDACSGDDDLRGEVELLLASHRNPTATPVTRLLEGAWMLERKEIDTAPEVPRYRILRTIGEGGMGTVFEADQLEPVERRVAIKVVKLGLDTKEIVRRFEAERQALALMDHPAIARVFDAGATLDGRPFFAMEYVSGSPITTYCAAAEIDLRLRLRLFVAVCEAVQHAHQKGVIHRDLKPSNILVEEVDGRPLPKIIDFGIAKALDRPLSNRPVHTERGKFLGTPGYMSPEQEDAGAAAVDTRSDVYSLGVLLFELLTGSLPAESTRGKEPRRPSEHVIEQHDSINSTPRTDPRRLRGDLDWIALKALAPDRNDRYPSCSELAADIERHLEDLPVSAGPPRAMYRLGKLIRRHRRGVLASVLAATALLVGSAGALIGLIQAKKAQALATEEAATAEEVTRFLVDIFQVSNPDEETGSSVTAREILDRGLKRIDTELSDQPLEQARLMEAMGQVYDGLGIYGTAEELFRGALARQRAVHGEVHERVATVERSLASVLSARGNWEEAEALLVRSLATRRELESGDDEWSAHVLVSLGNLYWRSGRYEEAESHLEEALSVFEANLGEDHLDVATTLNTLGALLYTQGRLEEARPAWEQALEIREQLLGVNHQTLAISLNNLGLLLQALEEFDQAERLLERAVGIQEKTLGPDHPNLAASLNNVAELALRRGAPDEAQALYQRAAAIQQRAFGEKHPEYARTLSNLGKVAIALDQPEQARELLERSLAIREEILDSGHIDLGWNHALLARHFASQDDLTRAKRHFDKAIELIQTAAPDHPDLSYTLSEYSEVLRRMGDEAETAVGIVEG